MIAICVTNDIIYDQRMQRIASSLAHHTDFEVKIIGRTKRNHQIIEQSTFKSHRLKCLFQKGFLFYLEYNIRLFFYLISLNPHIVYACDPDTLLGAGLYKILFKKQGVYDSHEYFIETPEIGSRPIVKAIWSRIEKVFCRNFDLHFSVNEELSSILSNRLCVDFIPLRNLPFKSVTSNILNTQEKVLLYQGVLNEGRGLECAIRMMEFLPHYKLWIVGDGDIKTKLISIAKEIKYPENIVFLGKKTPAELKSITQKARYGLNLLESTSLNYYYSLANKFFDYMMAGVPSINMQFPVYERYCKIYQCGITVQHLEAQEIANRITDIDNDPNRYYELSKSSLQSHLILNWEKEQDTLLENIKKLSK